MSGPIDVTAFSMCELAQVHINVYASLAFLCDRENKYLKFAREII